MVTINGGMVLSLGQRAQDPRIIAFDKVKDNNRSRFEPTLRDLEVARRG
jgi:hypothetical protein